MDRKEKLIKQFSDLATEELAKYYATLERASALHREEMEAIEIVVSTRFPGVANEESILTKWGTFKRKVSNAWQIIEGKDGDLAACLDKDYPVYVKETPKFEVVENRVTRLRELLGEEYGSLIREQVKLAFTGKFRSAIAKDAELAQKISGIAVVDQSVKISFESVPSEPKEIVAT